MAQTSRWKIHPDISVSEKFSSVSKSSLPGICLELMHCQITRISWFATSRKEKAWYPQSVQQFNYSVSIFEYPKGFIPYQISLWTQRTFHVFTSPSPSALRPVFLLGIPHLAVRPSSSDHLTFRIHTNIYCLLLILRCLCIAPGQVPKHERCQRQTNSLHWVVCPSLCILEESQLMLAGQRILEGPCEGNLFEAL